ncbi:MAG: nitrilase-related carbon-nitrogen hydrolase, partial [Actinomycetota bacterium]
MLRVALAQINPVVGDIAGNTETIRRAVGKAAAAGAGLVAFPELALTGYPPEDLLFKQSFVEDNVQALHELARSVEIPAVIGYVEPEGDLLYNAAAIVSDGRVLGTYRKHHLPNYGVFDERRYFHPGDSVLILDAGGVPLGVTICEDLWDEGGPHAVCAAAGARWILNINASPYHRGKGKERMALIARRAKELGTGFLYVNMVGGQDELVFDGQSVVVGPRGDLICRAVQFRE